MQYNDAVTNKKTTTKNNKKQQKTTTPVPQNFEKKQRPMTWERSIAIFCFRGAFKTKVPFSFVTFLLGKQKKSKEDEQRTKDEHQ